MISHATTQRGERKRGRKRKDGGRKHEMYFASSKQKDLSGLTSGFTDFKKKKKKGHKNRMNLKGTQCAHCREIYSLLSNKSISFGHFMTFFMCKYYVSFGVSQS